MAACCSVEDVAAVADVAHHLNLILSQSPGAHLECPGALDMIGLVCELFDQTVKMYHDNIYTVSTVNKIWHRLISSEEVLSIFLRKALNEQRSSLQTSSIGSNCIVLEEDDWRLLVSKLSRMRMDCDDIMDAGLR